VGKSEGRIFLEKTRHQWEDDTEMALEEIVWESLEWIRVPQSKEQLF
jgi:hypothetical protein